MDLERESVSENNGLVQTFFVKTSQHLNLEKMQLHI